MAKRKSRDNVIAGGFMLGGLTLGMVVLVILADIDVTARTRYIVRFSLADGAFGLDKGSPVTLGGQEVGVVRTLRFVEDESTDRLYVEAGVDIRSDVVLYEDASATLVVPLLGTSSLINISDRGDGENLAHAASGSGPRLEEGEMLVGTIAPPAFLAQAGYGDEQRRLVQSIIQNVEQGSASLRRTASRVEDELDPATERVRNILENTEETTANTRALTADAREAWASWRERVETFLTAANDIGERVKESVTGTREQLRELLASAQATLDDNRPRIDNTIRNIDELTQKLNEESYALFRDSLAEAMDGLESFTDATEQAAALLRESTPEIQTMIANGRLASEQLRLTMTEVRASPWRLLYRPTRKELENELLYNTVRSYSNAVSNLEAAAEALQAVAADGRPLDERDRATVDRLLGTLQETFQEYKERERAFFETWLESN